MLVFYLIIQVCISVVGVIFVTSLVYRKIVLYFYHIFVLFVWVHYGCTSILILGQTLNSNIPV